MGLKEKFSKKGKSEKSTGGIKTELSSDYGEGKKQIVGQAHRLKNLWKSKEGGNQVVITRSGTVTGFITIQTIFGAQANCVPL